MKENKRLLILLLGLLTAVGPLSIDMYLPAFPVIAADLHTTVGRVSLSLSSFFAGISVGQLIYGPLLERFGRKKPLTVGLVIYLLASFCCAMARSVDSLIVFRLLQATGSCAGLVGARAIVRDLFPAKENARIFSSLMLVVAVSPIIAPTLGSYMAAAWGWRPVFFVLAGVAALLLVGVYFRLPESKQPDPSFSLKPAAVLGNFRSILFHPVFYVCAFTGAIAYAGLYAYISGSPYVYMELFRISETYYGWIFALIAAGLIGSTQVNTVLLRYFSSEQLIRAACLCQSLVSLILVTTTWLGWTGPAFMTFLLFLFVCGQGIIFPNSSALSLTPFARTAGSASALMGALQMFIGAGASALVGVWQDGTAVPMTVVMAACSVTAFLLFSIGRKKLPDLTLMLMSEEKGDEPAAH
ncbi:multidrug effflux MFS transporter [Siphonobacter aquaeclarae]|uniref:MFS transporter, DHA1 family, bicyclomycin/chloramphenicol resistance protein n=1 Tax=Siphonobacter aquaeclarae TaxID=563176 RepID=A0A1G9I220_9BACT|nr:multidrug effflux MFS transporter [Siphonobacter aquaeclarae]SDL19281.1 MFS transporter, DHA1 family, bicyclomycin/chloramphenicol resistance protein [Siphonobacter aquaeclarae]